MTIIADLAITSEVVNVKCQDLDCCETVDLRGRGGLDPRQISSICTGLIKKLSPKILAHQGLASHIHCLRESSDVANVHL